MGDAHVGGLVVCSGATFSNERGPALSADRLAVGSDMSRALAAAASTSPVIEPT